MLLCLLEIGSPFNVVSQSMSKVYTDTSHYSTTFNGYRNYRVYLPEGYGNEGKRYPVIYFFHGYGGRHNQDYNALLEYETAGKYQPTTAELWFQLAICFAEANRNLSEQITQTTIDLFQKALALEPQHAQSHFQLGELLYSMDKELAKYHYKQAVVYEPELVNFFIDQVPAYYSGQLTSEQARLLIDKSLLLDSDQPLAYFYLAQIEVSEGNNELAIQNYEKAIELDPEYADVYFPLGDLYYQIGNRQRAREVYLQAIELDPELKTHFFEK